MKLIHELAHIYFETVFKFHYVQMKQGGKNMKEKEIIMFKFHYVQMKPSTTGVKYGLNVTV